MSDEMELVKGSDNPFADVGLPDADTKLIKADLLRLKLSVSCGNGV